MKVKHVLACPGLTGFYTDDKAAILKDAPQDGFIYRGKPVTPGFRMIRQPGESVLIALVLEDGEVALGDCAGTQYSGSGGREPPFTAAASLPLVERHIRPLLEGMDIRSFRDNAERIDAIRHEERPLHPAIRYGVTQAILEAVGLDRRLTKAEIVAAEFGVEVSKMLIPTYAQTGDERYTNVDKMILKRVDILPHGLINNVKDKVGAKGEKLLDYVGWVSRRIRELGEPDYRPKIHVDTYGTVGYAFDNDIPTVADYLVKLERAAAPFEFIIEMPIDLGSKEAQLAGMGELKRALRERGSQVKLMIDEWCNNLDDLRQWVDSGTIDKINVKTITLGGVQNIASSILYCNAHGVGAMMGGTCNETDISAMMCAHIAMATQPEAIAARPGMGVDEGLMTVYNEMARIQMLTSARAAQRSGRQR